METLLLSLQFCSAAVGSWYSHEAEGLRVCKGNAILGLLLFSQDLYMDFLKHIPLLFSPRESRKSKAEGLDRRTDICKITQISTAYWGFGENACSFLSAVMEYTQ